MRFNPSGVEDLRDILPVKAFGDLVRIRFPAQAIFPWEACPGFGFQGRWLQPEGAKDITDAFAGISPWVYMMRMQQQVVNKGGNRLTYEWKPPVDDLLILRLL